MNDDTNRGAGYFKALKIIDSCITEDHFEATRSYLDNYHRVFVKNSPSYADHKAALDLFQILLKKFHDKLNLNIC